MVKHHCQVQTQAIIVSSRSTPCSETLVHFDYSSLSRLGAQDQKLQNLRFVSPREATRTQDIEQ